MFFSMLSITTQSSVFHRGKTHLQISPLKIVYDENEPGTMFKPRCKIQLQFLTDTHSILNVRSFACALWTQSIDKQIAAKAKQTLLMVSFAGRFLQNSIRLIESFSRVNQHIQERQPPNDITTFYQPIEMHIFTQHQSDDKWLTMLLN